MMQTIADQTNLYSTQEKTCVCTDKNEMERYIGILIRMALFKLPRYRMYWEAPFFYEKIAKVMSRDRFEALKRFLHFNDNTYLPAPSDPDRDRLYRISPILQRLRSNCLKIEPEEKNAVDEQIIPFKGTCHMKLYLPNKPHKWGFKVISRSGASGMTYDFEFFTGKVPETINGIGMRSADVVLRLCSTLPLHKNFKVYCDNYFNSIELQLKLKEMGIWSVGTLRSNRLHGCPLKDVVQLKTEGCGAFDFRCDSKTQITCVRWFDKNAVQLCSTFVGCEPIGYCERYDRSKKRRIKIRQPAIVAEYNKYMGGVDLSDMLNSLYRIDHKSKKWYSRIFYWAVGTAIVNGWLLYRRHMELLDVPRKEQFDLLKFMAFVSDSLIFQSKEPEARRRPGRPARTNPEAAPPTVETQRSEIEGGWLRRRVTIDPQDCIRFDLFAHFPCYRDDRPRCKYCGHRTRMGCEKCGVGLCAPLYKHSNCFKEYHHR